MKIIFGLIAPFLFFILCFFGSCAQEKFPPVTVIELRNYLIKNDLRDKFIDTFKVYIEDSQNARGAFILGKYQVKDAARNFFWIRGFENMPARKSALEGFYNSAYWSATKRVSAGVVINYDNVYLLKPIDILSMDSIDAFNASRFNKKNGITVVDFYIANGRRNEMLAFFKNKYLKALNDAGVRDITFWISEDQMNNYPQLPMFQDPNLLVSISLFNNEHEYTKSISKLSSAPKQELNLEMQGIVTDHHTLILYPVK